MKFARIVPNLESCTLLVEAYGEYKDLDQVKKDYHIFYHISFYFH